MFNFDGFHEVETKELDYIGNVERQLAEEFDGGDGVAGVDSP